MSEFVMEGRDHAARTESEFVFGFIEALFFTERAPGWTADRWFTEEREAEDAESGVGGSIPEDVGYCDLHPDTLTAIRRDCEAWQEQNAALLEEAYSRDDYGPKDAGADYWFTRNGHGIGFWCRDALDEDDLGERLSDACRGLEVYVFFSDRVTYGDAPFVHCDGLRST